MQQEKKKHYIYVEVPLRIKNKAKRLAKKHDVPLRKWIAELVDKGE